LDSTKPNAWECSLTHERSWSRQQQLDFFTGQNKVPFVGFSRQFSFRECYQVANRFRFQIQPRSGFAFHTARTVQSAICGSIPIILIHPDYLHILAIEAPFAVPEKNCLLGLDGAYDNLLEQVQDEEHCLNISKSVPDLMQDGFIRHGLNELAEMINNLLLKN